MFFKLWTTALPCRTVLPLGDRSLASVFCNFVYSLFCNQPNRLLYLRWILIIIIITKQHFPIVYSSNLSKIYQLLQITPLSPTFGSLLDDEFNGIRSYPSTLLQASLTHNNRTNCLPEWTSISLPCAFSLLQQTFWTIEDWSTMERRNPPTSNDWI